MSPNASSMLGPSRRSRARFWASVPFVLPQGLMLRRRAPTVTSAQGPTTGHAGAAVDEGFDGDGEIHVLALGDSIIAGVGVSTTNEALPAAFARHLAARLKARVYWRAVGEMGARAKDVVDRLVLIDDARGAVDVVLVSVGVNDVTGVTRTRAFAERITHLLVHLGTRAPDATVVLAGLPPLHLFPLLPEPLRAVLGRRAHILDDTLAKVAGSNPRAIHIPTPFNARDEDFSADGFHPNANAVDEWAAHVARTIPDAAFAPQR